MVYSENFDGGSLGTFTSTGAPGWTASTDIPRQGAYSAAAKDPGSISDQSLVSAPIAVPTGLSSAKIIFQRYVTLDQSGGNNHAGAVVEISTDGGSTWFDAGTKIVMGAYDGTVWSGGGNPLAGRSAWVGSDNAWHQVTVNVLAFQGQSIRFRVRLGTDNSGASGYVHVDTVSDQNGVICGP